MKKSASILLCLSALVASRATMIEVTTTFTGDAVDFNGSAVVHPFSGSYSYVYDDSLVPSSGIFQFAHVVPTALHLDHPVFGSTTFDLTNTLMDVGFQDHALYFTLLGDNLTPNTVNQGEDDFLVLAALHDGPGEAGKVLFYASTLEPNFFGGSFSFPATLTTRAVPENGAAIWLLASGLTIVAGFHRDRRKTLGRC